ncbi:hypothetical protein Hanom_Chr15g01359141 [Helianthus anomalus]
MPYPDVIEIGDTISLYRRLFLKIVGDIEATEEWFQKSYDTRGKPSFIPIQKCTSAIRQLATSNPPDQFDEYLAMSDRTSRECLQFFFVTRSKNCMVKSFYVNRRDTTSHVFTPHMRLDDIFLGCSVASICIFYVFF